ncbi:hypothetical protein [Corallococcus sp. AB011P]|uniref:hypothetical protein n=1 Tax=Corallococcus sp. AB011P TaxID=2316735 RepID=UPI0011C43C42|nr:hypothetical protein [Corallococcus sp. AB011P]
MSGFDFTVHDRSGQVKVQADVKARLGTTREWAAGYWSNLEAVDLRPRGEFFLRIRPASDVPGRLKTGPGRAQRAPRGVSWSGTGLEG